MNIVFSGTDEAPLYQQIFDQVGAQIVRGEIAGGSALPSIRDVAKELRISVITVKRAWEELERAGLIRTHAGKGCFVTSQLRQELEDKRLVLAAERLERDIGHYRSLGITKTELIALIEKTEL
jgi:GntR family transcriptional regulator